MPALVFGQTKIRVSQIEDIQGTVIKSAGEVTGKVLTTNGSGGALWQAPIIYAPLTGSTNYIQNQNSSAQTANMWINGNGKFGNTLDAIGGFLLNGTNINTAGTLTNVAYLNATNTFNSTTATNALPATSGTSQPSAAVRITNAATTAVLDIGLNAGSTHWIQSTNVTNLATTYPLLLNPNGGQVRIGSGGLSTHDGTQEIGGFYGSQSVWGNNGQFMAGLQFNRLAASNTRYTITTTNITSPNNAYDNNYDSFSVLTDVGTDGIWEIDFAPQKAWTANGTNGYTYANGTLILQFYNTDIASNITVELYNRNNTTGLDEWTTVGTVTGNTNRVVKIETGSRIYLKKIRITVSGAITSFIRVSSIEWFPSRQSGGDLSVIPMYSGEAYDITTGLNFRDNSYVQKLLIDPKLATPIHVLQGATQESPIFTDELIQESNIWTSTGWTGDWLTGWTHTFGTTTTLTNNTLAAISFNFYYISWTITSRTAGSVTVSFGGVANTAATSSSGYGLRAVSTAGLTITPTSDFNGRINISVKRISALSNPSFLIKNTVNSVVFEIRGGNTNPNTFIGTNAGGRNVNGIYGTFIGINAGVQNIGGSNNTGIGYSALNNGVGGSYNTAVGQMASFSNVSGNYNTSLGYQSMYSTTSSNNTAIGASALMSNTLGISNTGVGYYSLNSLSGSYSNNTALGSEAGRYHGTSNSLTQATQGTFIGALAKASANNITNETVIGYNAVGAGANTVQLGNTSVVEVKTSGRVTHGQGTLGTHSALIGDLSSGSWAGKFTNVSAINLSDGFFPYHISDASGFANSVLKQVSTRLLISTEADNGVDKLQVAGTASGTTDATLSNQFVRLGQLSIENWNTSFGWGNHAGLYRPISYVPTWSEIDSKPTFATVATTGSYNDLTNKPTHSNNSDVYVNLTYFPTPNFTSSGSISFVNITGSTITANLNTTAVTAGSYTNANITIGGDGRITAASNGSSGYTLPLAANGTRGGIQIGYTSTVNNFALQLSSEKAFIALPDATTFVKGIASFNTNNFSTSSGDISLANAGISHNHLSHSTISGLSSINSGITSTDEIMISYGGQLRKTRVSVLGDYMQGYLNFGSGGMTNPMTTAGDIITAGSGGTPQRLGIGSAGQILQQYMGGVGWGNISGNQSSGIVQFGSGSGITGESDFSYNSSANTLSVGSGSGNGSVTSGNFIASSDRRLKERIEGIPDLEWADKIGFKTFVFRSDDSKRQRYGVIAQEVELINPELVFTNEEGVKSVGYIDLLIAKVARQDEIIEQLIKRLEKLENEK